MQKNNYMVVPRWLIVMYKTIFFSSCLVHPNSKKNDSDHFCIDCLCPLCSNCLPSHMCHKHVKLFNCSGIQRRQQQVHQHNNNLKEYRCIICHRSLQDNSRYCSIACKVLAIHGDERKRRMISCNEKDGEMNKLCFQYGNEEFLAALPFPRRKKLRRKGVPLRAPMF
ncbi:hypothetical protein PanWU01x14_082360 [Parasponia andersonii]|uniref:PLATZ transcription factor family protein n=1 Tax=Parasponia andersonii TaxID=3476 RepID=A0A2P5DAL0_PARAD|nr:hypothetical protein PanWU01x14_082360 [Parasponia andersonii]